MSTIRCRHCPDTFPNPIRMRVHTREAHPEHANKTLVPAKPLVPARGPRPGGSLKREDDTWPARA